MTTQSPVELERSQQVIVQLESHYYGFEVMQVQEMLEMPELTALPRSKPHVRGVMNLRGTVVPVLDLRMRLGLPSIRSEASSFAEMVRARQREHQDWVQKLENSVREGTDFDGALDPTMCKCGKWIASYVPQDRQVAAVFERLSDPHRRLHDLAAVIQAAERSEALQRIEAIHNEELAELNEIFDRLCEVVFETVREVAVILRTEDRSFAVSVDDVVAVEHVTHKDPSDIEQGAAAAQEIAQGIAMRPGDKSELMILLDTQRLIEETEIAD
jgi:chemotaxis signal transduction protein